LSSSPHAEVEAALVSDTPARTTAEKSGERRTDDDIGASLPQSGTGVSFTSRRMGASPSFASTI
jgi:hypothetical protein